MAPWTWKEVEFAEAQLTLSVWLGLPPGLSTTIFLCFWKVTDAWIRPKGRVLNWKRPQCDEDSFWLGCVGNSYLQLTSSKVNLDTIKFSKRNFVAYFAILMPALHNIVVKIQLSYFDLACKLTISLRSVVVNLLVPWLGRDKNSEFL